MNLDELTIGDVKKLKRMIGDAKEMASSNSCCDDGKVRIVVLQRGWVAVGRYYQQGADCRLEGASIIRNWGTSKGLGEIAENGPTDKTILDKGPTLRFNELTVVVSLDCKESKWAKHVD